MKLEAEWIDALLFGTGGRRFTQDSPILPEVWQRFGQDADDARHPLNAQDLLLTPFAGARPHEVAAALADALASTASSGEGVKALLAHRSRSPQKKAAQEALTGARIAFNQTTVAVTLTFEQLIQCALPLTGWWKRYLDRFEPNPPGSGPANPRDGYRALAHALRRMAASESETLKAMLGREKAALSTEQALAAFQVTGTDRVRLDRLREPGLVAELLWMVRTAGALFRGLQEPFPPNQGETDVEGRRRREGLWDAILDSLPATLNAVADWLENLTTAPGPDTRGFIFTIAPNRPAAVSVSASRQTVKADACGRVFDIRCDGITWGIVDTGVDATHPAFRLRDRSGLPFDEAFVDAQDHYGRPYTVNNTRIRGTFDFTEVRDLLLYNPLGAAALPEETQKRLNAAGIAGSSSDEMNKSLRRALQSGRELDWAQVRPLIEVPHRSETYRRPTTEQGHGTHVAGILGANWDRSRPAGDARPAPPAPPLAGGTGAASVAAATGGTAGRMPDDGVAMADDCCPALQGICPDILLYDLRVLRGDDHDDEFSVISALQFVRHLNAHHDQMEIHGVNVSLSIHHDVRNYACGRTPVCDECERLVGSGVIVVAAAGNAGWQDGAAPQGLPEGYRTVTITDPGNAASVITVGSTHRTQPHTYGVSYFSSRGPTGDGRRKPDIVAPGEKIEAPFPNNDLCRLDGTSMAAPHVSGAAALLLARNRELIGQPNQIKQILCETATDLGREPYFQGAGMLDILRAQQAI